MTDAHPLGSPSTGVLRVLRELRDADVAIKATTIPEVGRCPPIAIVARGYGTTAAIINPVAVTVRIAHE